MTFHSLTQIRGGRVKDLLVDKGVQHLIVSLVVLCGGGCLLAAHPDMKGEVFSAFGFLLGWWFRGQSNGNGNGKP